MAAIKTHNPDHTFWGLGGDHMIKEGLDARYHVRDLSVTGFVEVLKHLSFFREVMATTLEACVANKPDAAILIDYPGFNLRLGMKLKVLGIPVYYYISPQVWAWKKGRVKTMRQFIKRMFVIFPFEAGFFRDHDIPVTFAGHPLVEKDLHVPPKNAFFAEHGLDLYKPLIAVLPGSRRNEIEKLTPPLLETIQLLKHKHGDAHFLLAGLSSLNDEFYTGFRKLADLTVVMDNPYPVMAHADVAIVASGTASLETAFLGTPLVVIYKIAPLSYLIGKLLVKIDHLAMPNLILGERAIPELIQGQANAQEISAHIDELLSNNEVRGEMIGKLGRLRGLLGDSGCSTTIANMILEELI